jgi:hypothetical protein
MKHVSEYPLLRHSHALPLLLIPLFFLINPSCSSDKEKHEPEPNLVIIGEDLSGTFDQFPATTETDLRDLCKALETTKDGGKVYFIGIGISDPKGYAHCTIRPKKEINRSDPASAQKQARVYNLKVEKANSEQVATFIASASVIFQQRNQKYTDINGFFEKVSSILATPAHKKYKKWLYVNSDGKQSTPATNKVDCALRPAVNEYYVNRGWKGAADCGAAEKLPDTQHFTEHFRSQMEVQSLADQNK